MTPEQLKRFQDREQYQPGWRLNMRELEAAIEALGFRLADEIEGEGEDNQTRDWYQSAHIKLIAQRDARRNRQEQ